MLNNIKACIFDMDGTIIDSMWMWRSIDEDFLGKRDIQLPENLQKEIEGMNFRQTAIYFKNTFNLTEDLDEIMHIWNNMALDKYCTQVSLKPGAHDFLCKLKENHIPMGIATSNSAKLAKSCLKALEIMEFFDIIITGDDVKCGKPDPECYNLCIEKLGVSPDKCLVFEDIPAGIDAAHEAGALVCAVYDAYSSDVDDYKKAAADYYIDSFTKISEVL